MARVRIQRDLRRDYGSSSADRHTFTMTLPAETVVDLSNVGVRSGRATGNLSYFCQIGAEVLVGLLTNPEAAKMKLLSLIRTDTQAADNVRALADNLEDTARRLREMFSEDV